MQSQHKPLNFIFRTDIDPWEKPAKFTAELLKSELERRGHKVEVNPTPEEYTYLPLVKHNLSDDETMSLFKKRTEYSTDLHLLAKPETNLVVDFHNSDREMFRKVDLGKIHRYSSEVHDTGNWQRQPTSPIALLLKPWSTRERIIATLELPAFMEKHRGKLARRMKEIAERLRNSNAPFAKDSGVFFSYQDFQNKHNMRFPLWRARKAGLFKKSFIKKLADEFEFAAAKPKEFFESRKIGGKNT